MFSSYFHPLNNFCEANNKHLKGKKNMPSHTMELPRQIVVGEKNIDSIGMNAPICEPILINR